MREKGHYTRNGTLTKKGREDGISWYGSGYGDTSDLVNGYEATCVALEEKLAKVRKERNKLKREKK